MKKSEMTMHNKPSKQAQNDEHKMIIMVQTGSGLLISYTLLRIKMQET